MFVIVIVFFFFSKKKEEGKKKKKKKKNDPSFGLGKKTQKSYATIVPLSIFSLGKGRETLIPQVLF